MNEYMKKRYKQRREEIIAVLGGKCKICASQEELQLDHIRWEDKEIKLNKLWNLKEDKIRDELKKCQVLCKPCHDEKSKKDISDIRKFKGV